MCGTCGCGEKTADRDGGVLVPLERRALRKNDALAARNRAWLEERGVLAVNVLSSPGSGETTLLEQTIRDLGAAVPIAVVEGDQATERDADRIRAAGGRALRANTGTGCHLDASMIARALDELAPAAGSVLFIENVGDLVCPSLIDLGEAARVVVASVTEGEDKPIKCPHMFRSAHVLLVSKQDLAAHVEFDAARFTTFAREVNPSAVILPVSARTGDGMARWYDWLRAARVAASRASSRAS